MSSEYLANRSEVANDFRRARRQAELQDVLSGLTGRSSELLSYEDVRRQLRGRQVSGKKLEYIPMDAIVGSSGRYQEFTRGFMPRKYIRPERWIGVKIAMTGLTGVPPIDVYGIGEVYFVQDGNHRVSVARQMGLTHIQAYVTEVKIKVPLTKNTRPDELIIAAEYLDFLDSTRADELRPGADLRVTAPGKYPLLLEHIEVHRYYMGIERQHYIDPGDAFGHWYDTVYQPLVESIDRRDLLRHFPGRTAADLYLWISQHRAELENALGWDIAPVEAISDLVAKFNPKATQPNPLRERLQAVLDCDETQSRTPEQPPQGRPAREARVVDDLLVAVDGLDSGWNALSLACQVASQEGGARLYGLYVAPTERERDGKQVRWVREEFERRCQAAGVTGRLAVEVGGYLKHLINRARWVDLVIAGLVQPAPSSAIEKLGSGIRNLVRNCPRPVVVVPGAPTSMRRVVLSYDGGPKSNEALYAATYLAGWWAIELVVVSAGETVEEAVERQAFAREYLRRYEVEAEFVAEQAKAAELILRARRARQADLILCGGYSLSPALELVLGSTVDRLLREAGCPVLICN